MNWGENLTMVGAIRRRRRVTLGTYWRGTTRTRFVRWVRRHLGPRLRPGDIVVMDRLPVHRAAAVRAALTACGATLKLLPAYSPDLNPIEPALGHMKKYMRAAAPTTGTELRRAARRGWRRITPHHCRQWFAHAGYGRGSANRD
jgi:transposase